MKCVDCKFLSEKKPSHPTTTVESEFTSVRCTKGRWDNDNKPGVPQYYAWGSAVRNRGPIRRHGENCSVGEPKNESIGKEKEKED